MSDREHRTLAGVYLLQATEAFRASISSDGLYGSSWARVVLKSDRSRDEKQRDLRSGAQKQQKAHCRTSMLFSALAAEAYVNEYLTARLGKADFEAVDRLRTAEKLVIGTRIVGGPTYSLADGDGQIFAALFKLRNDLVHPRPDSEYGSYATAAEWPRRHDVLNSPEAEKYLLSVARVGLALMGLAYPQYPDSPSWEINQHAKTLANLATRWDYDNIPWHDEPPAEVLISDIAQIVLIPPSSKH